MTSMMQQFGVTFSYEYPFLDTTNFPWLKQFQFLFNMFLYNVSFAICSLYFFND